MNRRELVVSAVAMALAPMTQAAEGVAQGNRAPPPFERLIQPATDCLVKGQTCLSHCIYLVGEGQKEMATVARNVNEMLALCAAVQALAIQHGRQLGGLAPLAVAAAEAAEAECRKYAQQHAQCSECAEACVAFIAAGRQFQREFAVWQQSMSTR